MKNITYTTITNSDELEILRDKSSFNYKFDDELIGLLKKNLLLPDSFYILAKSDGKFAGFCSVDRDWWEKNYFFLREILVDPDFQKQSIGQEMMSRCVEHAKRKGAVGVITETDFANIPMQNLCTKIGFKLWNNPEWEDGITYKLLF
jgi:GNAT superfamily N-acetyltransferase